jgi:hypothetical protein
MVCTSLVRNTIAGFAIIVTVACAPAAPTNGPTNGSPADPNFIKLPNGKLLTDISVRGVKLSLTTGRGVEFNATAEAAYKKLKAETQTNRNHKVQWAFMDLDRHSMIAQSASAERKVFGASSSKIYVASALLAKQQGEFKNANQLQLMADMIVVSSNTAWVDLQTQIGNGVPDKGREYIHGFTQGLGYEKTRAFQGYWGTMHGNELVATEIVEFLHDMYRSEFAGAETVWKIMHTCRTGGNRGLKYIPTNIYVGAKTGTYDGPTEDPETGSTKNSDGSNYTVKIRNHVMVFNVNGKQYGLAILSNDGSEETVAVLAGGLLREFTGL